MIELPDSVKAGLEFVLPRKVHEEILGRKGIGDLPPTVRVLVGYFLDKGGEGSGYYNHPGLPGVWGGSRSSGGSGKTPKISQKEPLRRSSLSKFAHARDKNVKPKYRPFVHPYTPKAYKEMGAKCYLSFTGKTGYALKPDGDIISIFSSEGKGDKAVLSAIARGGTKLDCYAGKLVKFYSLLGFVEYERWDWDDQYKPDNWDYEEFNRPDVVLMHLKGKEE